jgi:hypothetical protein
MLPNVASERRSKVSRWLLAVCFIVGYLAGHILTQAIAAPDPNALKVQGPDTLGTPIPVFTSLAGAGGVTQTFLSQSSANAAATNNVSLGAAVGQTTYVTGFQITGGGATGASNIAVTLANVVTGTNNYVIVVPAGATTSINPLVVQFVPPLPANAQNQIITLNVPSFGVGNTNAAASIQGYRQ